MLPVATTSHGHKQANPALNWHNPSVKNLSDLDAFLVWLPPEPYGGCSEILIAIRLYFTHTRVGCLFMLTLSKFTQDTWALIILSIMSHPSIWTQFWHLTGGGWPMLGRFEIQRYCFANWTLREGQLKVSKIILPTLSPWTSWELQPSEQNQSNFQGQICKYNRIICSY